MMIENHSDTQYSENSNPDYQGENENMQQGGLFSSDMCIKSIMRFFFQQSLFQAVINSLHV